MHDLRSDAQMREHREMEWSPSLFSKDALPLFAMFFLWSLGTSALLVGWPLLAYELSASLFAVGATFALGGVPSLTTPLIGVLVDRLGRRRVLAMASVLHGGVVAMQAFTDSYLVFAGLAVVSGFAVAAWRTGSVTLLADYTRVTNRGRGVALRRVVVSLGMLTGPVLGGVLAQAFDLSAVFVLAAVSRVLIVVLVWFLVRETRPAPSSVTEAGDSPRRRLRLDVSLFMTRSFFVLTVVMLVLGLAATGHDGLLRRSIDESGFQPSQVGLVFSILGFLSLLVAMPVGSLVDSRGRRPVLSAGLVVIGAAVLLMPWFDGLLMLSVLLGVFTIGNLMTGIALETHAMDLAPERRKGYFLGTWLLMKNLIEGVAAFLVGATVLLLGDPIAIGVVGLVLFGMAAFLAVSRRPRS